MSVLFFFFFKSSHQQKEGADKFPAQPPVKSWPEAHHLLDVVAEAVHTWSEHSKGY